MSSRSSKGPRRGIFERPTGSGIWWVCYFDAVGRRHREKVGPKGLAVEVYEKRKTEVRERRFFPEKFKKRAPLVVEAIDDYLTALAGHSRSFRTGDGTGRRGSGC